MIGHEYQSISIETLNWAQKLIYKYMSASAQISWPLLNARLGTQAWVKHENHNPTGAFKVRGGLVYLYNSVSNSTHLPQLVSATRGNHGQSIAFSAGIFGAKADIFVPKHNCLGKNQSMEGFGAKLHIIGENFDATKKMCREYAQANDHCFVPSFHRDLVIGVATYALELMQEIKDLDKIYVPIGLGSGICGAIIVRNLLGLKTKIIGVVAQNADAYAQSFESGRIITNSKVNTFADGMAVGVPDEQAFEIIKSGADDVVRVNEDEIAEAIRIYFTDTHNIAEGAGAASLAAALKEKSKNEGKKIGLILSGGNIGKELYTQVLNGQTPIIDAG